MDPSESMVSILNNNKINKKLFIYSTSKNISETITPILKNINGTTNTNIIPQYRKLLITKLSSITKITEQDWINIGLCPMSN